MYLNKFNICLFKVFGHLCFFHTIPKPHFLLLPCYLVASILLKRLSTWFWKVALKIFLFNYFAHSARKNAKGRVPMSAYKAWCTVVIPLHPKASTATCILPTMSFWISVHAHKSWHTGTGLGFLVLVKKNLNAYFWPSWVYFLVIFSASQLVCCVSVVFPSSFTVKTSMAVIPVGVKNALNCHVINPVQWASSRMSRVVWSASAEVRQWNWGWIIVLISNVTLTTTHQQLWKVRPLALSVLHMHRIHASACISLRSLCSEPWVPMT